MRDAQQHASPSEHEDLKEVWFPIEKDEDGYPESRSWEGLWAHNSNGEYEIVSVPFYLKNVSRGDTVLGLTDTFLQFERVVIRGGHNTYRLLMHAASVEEIRDTIRELEDKQLCVEVSETGVLVSVDVPPTVNQAEIDAYLIRGSQESRWEMQDGYLNFQHQPSDNLKS